MTDEHVEPPDEWEARLVKASRENHCGHDDTTGQHYADVSRTQFVKAWLPATSPPSQNPPSSPTGSDRS